jgi:hypothetical protein
MTDIGYLQGMWRLYQVAKTTHGVDAAGALRAAEYCAYVYIMTGRGVPIQDLDAD